MHVGKLHRGPHASLLRARILADFCGAGGVTGDDAPAETNERGLLVKQLDEEAGWGVDLGEAAVVTFTIDKIEVDPPCVQFGKKPAKGHTLLLHVRVATGNDAEMAQLASAVLNPFSFAEITSSGVTEHATAGNCTDYNQHLQPAAYGINQKYDGTIEIVVPEASGVLIQQLPGDPGGWEWHY